MKKILLILIGLSAVAMATVTSSGGVATDSATNLQWQDDDAVTTTSKDWSEAITYCENLELGDKLDWRLPNKNELISIVDYGKNSDVFLDGFSKVSSNILWSSTTSANDAWSVDFKDGSLYKGFRFDNPFVRCVRGGL
jgi:hypothetical protein